MVDLIAQFITRMGPIELYITVCMLNLTESKKFPITIYFWQSTIREEIIKISDKEMRIAMKEEIRDTIINTKGE